MSNNPESKESPIAGVMYSRFGGNTLSQETIIAIPASGLTRIPNNPNRVSWQMINLGANDIRVSNYPYNAINGGWLLAASGGVMSMDWSEDGEGVCYDIYLIAATAQVNINFREVIRL